MKTSKRIELRSINFLLGKTLWFLICHLIFFLQTIVHTYIHTYFIKQKFYLLFVHLQKTIIIRSSN